jgi:hypothetical protein
MKKAAVLLVFVLLGSISARAEILFQDYLNYSNGLIATDGVWQVYYPSPPVGDAVVSNNLLILKTSDKDSVEAPFTNNTSSTLVYASFTIKVTSLPSASGSYFAEFQNTNDSADLAHFFAASGKSLVPGTYRLAIANYATSSSSATFYPLDLATNITYWVVMSYDPVQTDPYPGATLVVNPASEADFDSSPAYGKDNSPSSKQLALTNLTALAFSPYVNAGIGDVTVGSEFIDVFTNTPQAPVIGIQPQGATLYSGNNLTLYTAASGLGQLSYQWFSNNVVLTDDGVNVIGSVSNILQLINLQTTATYSVTVSNSVAGTPSAPAVVTVNDTPTTPFFLTEPKSESNGLGSTITLTASANGTGPLTYEWYFEATNASSFIPIASGPTLSLSGSTYGESGSYYVTASGGDGSSNSATVTVDVTTPPSVTIGYLHSLLKTNNITSGSFNLSNGASFTVQGVVTSFGRVESGTYSEFFVQDATGGALAFVAPAITNAPLVGSLVQIVGPTQQYYGQLELAPNPSVAGTITVLSTNNPLPAPMLLDIGVIHTNTFGAVGLAAQGALVTVTNAYLYGSSSGASIAGMTFPTNGSQALYAFNGPYAAGKPYLEVYVVTYTNVNNAMNTNFWGWPIPSYCYQLTGAIDDYSPTQPELIPSRIQDFVTTPPTPFDITVAYTNGAATINWPASVGSTYSVYSSPNVNGPWTQTFGLSYYPSTGSDTVTNSETSEFFWVSTP